ncbi:MAG: PAS domain S-box protein [Elusimicrobia bacterium]|nr:PAS domain S-box protein [Elusimicrobiota bacterium]
MDVRKKVFLLLAGFLLLIVLNIIGINILGKNQTNLIIRDLKKSKTRLLDDVMELKNKPMKAFVADYTFWNDMFSFVNNLDPVWAKENLDTGFKTFEINALWVLNLDFNVVYSINDLADKELEKFIVSKEKFRNIFKKGKFLDFYADTPKGLMRIRGTSIHKTKDPERKYEHSGYFFVGQIINEKYVSEISELLMGETTLIKQPVPSTDKIMKWPRYVYFIKKELKDCDGQTIGFLKSRITSLGAKELERSFSLFFIGYINSILIGLFLIWFILLRWVVNPLNKISASLSTSSFLPIEKLKKQRDEFGKIAELITNHFNEEKKLCESEEKYRAVVENAGEMVMVAQDELLKFVNQKTVDLLGFSREELIDKPFAGLIHPEDAAMVIKNYKNRIQEKSFVGVYSFRLVSKNGSIKWVEINATLIQWGGRPATLNFLTDITDRKKAEMAVWESELRYKTIFESSKDAIMLLTPEKGFFGGNPATLEMFRCKDEEEFTTKTPAGLSPEYQPDGISSSVKAQQMMAIAMEKGSHFFEWTHKRADGDEFFATVLLTRMELEGKEVLQATVRDITELKKAEEELRIAYEEIRHNQQDLIQASKMAAMGQLAAGISHELNQPLTGIKGFAQAVLMETEKGSPIRNDLKKILEQVDRMDAIIKNVRFFSRRSDFMMLELDINQVILSSLALLEQQLKTHNIRVIQELESGIPKMQGDSNQLQQAFLNIISNSRDAIISLNRPEGGEISIRSLGKDKGHIEITCQDTGCGIPEKNFQNIFTPFYTTKSPNRGMGLGLPITYRIIGNHQGKIDFKSEVGKGTTFTIVLPLKRTEHETARS